jgi:hypothetical protein
MKTAHELLKAFVCAGLAVLLIQTAAAQTTGTYDHFAHQRIEVERYVIQTYEHYIQRYPSLMGDHAWTGKQEDAQYDQNTFRMVYAWGLTGTSGIPTNATITNVRLYLQGTLTSNAPPNNPPTIDFQVRDFPPSSLTASADQKWTAINNAQTFATWSLQRSTGTFNTYIDYPQGSALANAVQSRLGGTFAIAMKAVDESWAQGAPTIHVVDFKQAPSVDPSSAVRIVVTYTVPANNPVPTITSISPNSAMEGGPAFTLTVYGTNFISSSVVRWNGSDRTTTFISGTEVRASISANDIASPGSASVTVYNPPPGGGTSNPATFTITAASVNVTVRQFLADGSTEVGTLGRWNGSSFEPRLPAPQQYTFQIPSTETLHGDTLIYSNQKHRIWKKLFVEEPNVINHHTFSITQGFPRSLTSQFAETKNDVIIKTDLIDLPGTTGGDIEFRDPWYIDYNDPNYANAPRNRGQDGAVLYRRSVGTTGFKPDYSTPYDGGRTYKGVFLNQRYDVPNAVYYSVGAPNPNTFRINNQDYQAYFQKWTGHPDSVVYQNANAQQTGVVFKQSGATATAKYKLHLASSSPDALAKNTQRKIIRDPFGTYHMVYTSGNRVYYSQFRWGAWSPEVPLRYAELPPDALERNPSIVFIERASYASHSVLVVWEAYDPSETTRCLMYCELDLNGQIVEGPFTYTCWDGNEPAHGPVVGLARFAQSLTGTDEGVKGEDGSVYYYYPLIVWYGYDPYGNHPLRAVVKFGPNSWSHEGGLIGLRGVTQFSLAPFSFGLDTWDLAYVMDNTLYYAPIAISSLTPTIGTSEYIAAGDLSSNVENPSIATVGGTLGVSWDLNAWEFVSGAVQYAERVAPNTWTSPVGWWPTWGFYRQSSLTATNTSTRVTLAWQQDAAGVFYVKGGSGGWRAPTYVRTGVQPSLSIGFTGADGELLLSRGVSSPYRIQQDGISAPYSPGDRLDPVTASPTGRGGIVQFPTGRLRLAVLHARIDNNPIGFAAIADTARPRTLQDFSSALRTKPFVGTGRLAAKLLFGSNGQVPQQARLRVVVQDSATGAVLHVLRTFSINNDTIITVEADLNYGSRRVVLSVQPTGFAVAKRFGLEYWYVIDQASQSPLASGPGHEAILSQLPTTYALHPNHPNPFNPTTTIRYDLPEDSHVSLIIYDVLGRKVAELENGMKEAGYHSALWNASDVASGVYFARFTATNADGNVKLNKVTKLLLTK